MRPYLIRRAYLVDEKTKVYEEMLKLVFQLVGLDGF